MKKALIPFLLSVIILSCGCDTNTEQLSVPEDSSVTDSKEDIQTTATSSEQLDFTSSNDNSEVKPDDNTIVFNSVTEYFPVSDTAEYGADAVLADYFPVIHVTESPIVTREYVGTTVPLDESYIVYYFNDEIYKTVEADGIDPDTKAPVTKKVDLYHIQGIAVDFAVAAKFEGDSSYYTYINVKHNSLILKDLFDDILDNYTVLDNVEKYDGNTVSKTSMTSDDVMNVWNTLFNKNVLYSSVENRCEKYGYENQENDLRGTVYTINFYINEINLPAKVTFGLNDELTITTGTVVYDFFAEDETIRQCIKLIDPDANM